MFDSFYAVDYSNVQRRYLDLFVISNYIIPNSGFTLDNYTQN